MVIIMITRIVVLAVLVILVVLIDKIGNPKLSIALAQQKQHGNHCHVGSASAGQHGNGCHVVSVWARALQGLGFRL